MQATTSSFEDLRNDFPVLNRRVRDNKKLVYLDNAATTQKPNQVIDAISDYYKNHNFIEILKPNMLVSTNDVINTNKCIISICKTKDKNKLIILSTIDNLIKGGAGQAIQNFNIKFNFPVKTGLK